MIQPYQWVMAQFPGYDAWLYAWYKGQNVDGSYIVEFSDDGPERLVSQIHPI